MSSIQLIDRHGTLLPPRVPTDWRELCVVDAKLAAQAIEQGGFAGFTGNTVTDHMYPTRWGSSSCSPPV